MIEWHVFLSTLSLVVMIIAGIQASLLMMQDYFLRHHAIRFLPSLEKLEKYLFRTVALGWLLLLIVFISSLITFGFFRAPFKITLTFIALGIFSLLLWGHYRFGWRGQLAVRWTFLGLILLLIIYCGTGLLIHGAY
jgi:ABC-type uncharacterized transport system permease subunit